MRAATAGKSFLPEMSRMGIFSSPERGQKREPLLAAMCDADLVPDRFQEHTQNICDVAVIVDDENICHLTDLPA